MSQNAIELSTIFEWYRQGRIAEVLHAAREVLRVDPGQPELLNLAAVCSLHLGEPPEQAEACWKQLLLTHPEFAEVHNNLGVLLQNQERFQEAEGSYREAIRIRSDFVEAYNNLGMVLAKQERFDEAESCYCQAFALKPESGNAFNRGNLHRARHRSAEAEAAYREALQLDPNHAEAYNNLGVLLQESNRIEEAGIAFREALRLKPDYAGAWNNLGGLNSQGAENLEEAARCYQQAIHLQPDTVALHNSLGDIYVKQGLLTEAEACYQQALRLRPDLSESYNKLGMLWHRLRPADAEAFYREAVRVEPECAEAWNNLSVLLQEQKRYPEAEVVNREALRLKPEFAEAHHNLANLLQDLGRSEEAIAAYRLAVTYKPDYLEAFCLLIHQLQLLSDWKEHDRLFHQMMVLFYSGKRGFIPFIFLSLPTNGREQRGCAEAYARKYAAIGPGLCDFRPPATPPERLRIGYLSGDFRNHPAAHLTAELFELHDRSRFEIIIYSYGPDDGHPVRKRIMAGCDRFVDLHALTYDAAARRIHEDGVHILVELQGFTRGTRLEIPAMRPAPIQATWLGYLGTIGAPFIDYVITDWFISPVWSESHFREKLVRLPCCYQPNDRHLAIDPRTPTRAEYGLPEEAFVFANFGNAYKITPEVYEVWMTLLRETPDSVLWLWKANPRVVENLCQEAESRGVSASRLIFADTLPLSEHLARYRLVDLYLDTFPYASGTTGSNTLWAGCPMVTCAGQTFASRQGGSLLMQVGLPELVTFSLEHYLSVVLELTRDRERLAGLRRRLQSRLATAPLFDTPRFVGDLERAYEAMWARYQAGLPPDHIAEPPGRTHD
ncbi:MAG: tetratricopeptide repeat protein [Magnetococcales bacterium]|nr:tetratricopeptide repeat protein [Magnetococcales bacterium]